MKFCHIRMIVMVVFATLSPICIGIGLGMSNFFMLVPAFVFLVLAFICALLTINKQNKLIAVLQANIRKQPNATEQLLQTKLAAKRLQLSLLQNQINPHFLYNTLDSIRGHALLQKQGEIAQIIECLSRYYRYCISRDEQIVTLDQEIKNVKDYFYIQHYRFGERISLNLQIEDSSEAELHYLIPKTVLQPLVENAILHGLEPLNRNGQITLSVCLSETLIYISISDNGIGISQKELEKLNLRMQTPDSDTANEPTHRHGVGLQNVNERIRLCFGNAYGLRFHSVEGAGTDVQLHFPKIDDSQYLDFDGKLRGKMVL